MADFINTVQLSDEEATALLLSLDLDTVRASSFWALNNFTRKDVFTNLLRQLPARMSRKCYALFRAEYVARGASGKKDPVLVYFWRDRVAYQHNIQPDPSYPVVTEAELPQLVHHAWMIQKAFENGYAARSREVRGSFADLLGVGLDRLDDVLEES